MITVHNPHPRLVNVALGNGKFTRVMPGGEAQVEKASVEKLLRSKDLVQVDSKRSRTQDDDADAEAAAQAEADAKAKAEADAANKGRKVTPAK